MADIPVNLLAQGNLAAETAKASAGMALLAANEEKAAKIAQRLAVTVDDVKAGIAAQTKAEAAQVKAQEKLAKDSAKAAANKAKEEKKALKLLEDQKIAKVKQDRVDKAYERSFKKHFRDVKDVLTGDITPLLEGMGPKVGMAAAAASVFATALLAAGAAALALLGYVTKTALETGKLRDESKAALDVLTDGRGAEALKLVDRLAKQLGTSITDTRAQFIKFRQEGLDNGQAAQLLKLKADLEAAGKPADQVADGLHKIIDQAQKAGAAAHKIGFNGKGVVDARTFRAALSLIAKEGHVAGDGILAAETNAKTLDGAMNRLENIKTIALEKIFDKISPTIDKVATKVVTLFEKFSESEQGQKALNGLADAIIWTAEATGTLIEKGIAFAQGAAAFVDWASKALGVTKGWGAAILLLAGPILSMTAIVIEKFGELLGLSPGWGKDLVLGVVKGIENAASFLWDKVTSLASGVYDAFASKLKIHSPSKEFEKLGMFTGKGFEIGLDKSMPDLTPDIPNAPASSISNSSNIAIGDIIINLANAPDGTPEDLARQIRREIAMLLSAQNLSRGID